MKHLVTFDVYGSNQAELEQLARTRLAEFTDGRATDQVEIRSEPFLASVSGAVVSWKGSVAAYVPLGE